MNKPLLSKLEHLSKLNKDTKQLWGKMSAQHMIEHLILAVRTSNGKLNIGCFNPPANYTLSFHERYNGGGAIALTDGRFGTTNFQNGE